jgi:4-carboxymuconolactone decarboxylase
VSYDGWVWDLVELAAAQAANNTSGMEGVFQRLEAAGRRNEVEEALLQSYLFLGFPSAIEALRRWRNHVAEAPEPTAEDWALWMKRGEEVCATVYGDHYASLRENIARFHPDLDTWMVAEGYGKVLGRPDLSLDIREMLIVAMLVVQGDRGRRQLRSHLKGALNAGVPREDIEETVRRASRYAPPGHLELAFKLWSLVNGDR